ncbi:MAG: Uma2 family endonuclease [Gemmatimonadetes bacterium]|nr:Uma2 family endonuclease [Gemmatimonadota bacterium]
MPQATQEWTAEMVRALPDDGKRYEVIDGELFVTPSPRLLHQRACLELTLLLRPYVRLHRLGEVLQSPADIEFDPKTLVQPDVFVAPLVGGRRPRTWKEVTGLLLAIEVLSPSSARADRVVKRRRYQRAGVPDYWLVDLDARLVERWRPSDQRPELVSETLAWQPFPSLEPFAIDLPAFFTEVAPEEEPE